MMLSDAQFHVNLINSQGYYLDRCHQVFALNQVQVGTYTSDTWSLTKWLPQ